MGNVGNDSLVEVIPDVKPGSIKKSQNPLQQLLPRQRKFLKLFIKKKSRADAWMEAYKCKTRESAIAASSRFLNSHPEVTDWLYQLSGLGDDDFVTVIREGMQAKKSQFYLGKQYEEPDHYARFKAVELGLKVRGKDDPKTKHSGVNIQIITDSKSGVFRIEDNEDVVEGETL